MDVEIWLDAPQNPYYKVSSHGRVKRSIPGKATERGKILKPYVDKYGYGSVRLSGNTRGRKWLVHRLVYDAFHGGVPHGMQINHKNGDKMDNRLVNLDAVTPSQNIQHGYDNGLHNQSGTKNNNARLTPEDIVVIRQRSNEGESQTSISRDFGISQSAVSSILNYKTWSHVE